MKNRIVFIVLCLFATSMTFAQDNDQDFPLELVDVQALVDIVQTSTGDLRSAVMSSDGYSLAYTSNIALCVYEFESEGETCFPFPEENENSESIRFYEPTTLQWSPDSTQIAMSPPALQFFVDADMWILNVETGEYTNYSDDNYEGSIPLNDEDAVVPPLDLVPTWSHNGDLYFFRYENITNDDIITQLYRIPSGADEAILIADLTEQLDEILPFYDPPNSASLDGTASISPDGTQMAILYRLRQLENQAIWLIDLQDGTMEEIVSTSNLPALALPEWTDPENLLFQASGIAWLNDNTLALHMIDSRQATPFVSLAFHFDIATGDIQAIFDFTDIPSASDYFDIPNDYDYPFYVVLEPSNSSLLFSQSPNFTDGGIAAISVTGGDSIPVFDFEEDEFESFPSYFASIGGDGETVRALLTGYIYIFIINQ